MSIELRVVLPGDRVDARKAAAELGQLLKVISSLEATTSDGGRSTWRFSHLGVGSVEAGIAVLAPRPGASEHDVESVLPQTLVGFREAEQHEGIPDGWTAELVTLACDLLKDIDPGGLDLELRENGRVVQAAHITDTARRHLEAGVEKEYRDSIGSLTGQLDTVTVHNKFEATLWPEQGGASVRMRFDADLVEVVKSHLGRRVEASGWIRRDQDGRVVQLKLRDLQGLPTFEESPPLTELVGLDPDFTGGLSAADYLREMRGEA